MLNSLKHCVFASVLLALTSGLANASSVIINVDAQWQYWSYHYSPILLDAGTYQINPIGISEGGAYNSWNAWGAGETSGCDQNGICDRGYLNSYSFGYVDAGGSVHEIATIGGSVVEGTAQAYQTQFLALAHSQSCLFTLTSPTSLYFYLRDGESWYGDNVGGMSLSIQTVPAPPVSILLLTALCLLGLSKRFGKEV